MDSDGHTLTWHLLGEVLGEAKFPKIVWVLGDLLGAPDNLLVNGGLLEHYFFLTP